ncbi:MAG: hypothetical protein ACE5HE_00765 [Phycisphaerae bacterium]
MAGATRDEELFVNEFRNLPEGWWALLGVALAAGVLWAVVWMYHHEGRIGVSRRRRTVLALLRCAVLVILALIVLEPVRVRILRRWVDSYSVVLIDNSSSMGLVDTYRDPACAARVRLALGLESLDPISRTTVVERLLNRADRRFLRNLTQNNRVKLYTFSNEPQLIDTLSAAREESGSATGWRTGKRDIRHAPSQDAQGALNGGKDRDTTGAGALEQQATQHLSGIDAVPTRFAATGRSTNIERAVRRTVESLGNAPIAAVVVISDGGFNEGSPAEETARWAYDRGLPIHVVGIGDPTRPTNVRVTDILAPENVFKHDPFTITAQLTSQGLEGRVIRVELRERRQAEGGAVYRRPAPGTDDEQSVPAASDDTTAGERVVDAVNVVVGPGGAIEPVTFQRRQESPGRFLYVVAVPVLDDESVADDNSKQMTVNVIDARTRVLLVAGQPSWEYRFVSRLLERDASVDVSCWLQSADRAAVRDGNTIIDHMPASEEELFAYDMILLMNPNHTSFNEAWCRVADRFVTEQGGGLLLTAARAGTPAFMRDPALRTLHDLLPVVLDPDADLILNQIGHYQLSGSPVDIPDAAYGHPVLRLATDNASTRLAWQGVGNVYWHYPVLREKPVATVLMRHADPRMRNSYGGHVLAAVQFVGAGRTGFLGFDGTWRWRRHGGKLFNRFWVQLVRYLAEGRLLGAAKRGMLLTNSDQFSLGDTVVVTARFYDERYEPLRRDAVDAYYAVDGQRTRFVMSAMPDQAGWYEGRFVPGSAGAYRITALVPGSTSDEVYEAAREIRVARPNIEITRPQADRAAMMTLAEKSAHGRYFEVDEMSELPALIPDLHEETSIRSRPTPLWDNWLALVILLSLLGVEWCMRKWSRLL